MAVHAFKFLIIADDTAEFAPALAFASFRAKALNAGLVILRVVDTSRDQAQWVAVGEEMRAEALEAAEALGERLAAETLAMTGVQPEIVIREGEPKAEMRKLIEQDRAIRMLVLGVGSNRDSPGPLVTAMTKGTAWGARAIPVVIVPGALSKDEARELASTGGEPGDASS